MPINPLPPSLRILKISDIRSHGKWLLATLFLLLVTGGAYLVFHTATPTAQPNVHAALTQPDPRPAASIPPSVPSNPVLDLFQPSPAQLQQQQSQTALDQQIENAMIVSYTLVRCDLMSQSEYESTYQALILYGTRMQIAPDAAQSQAKVRAIADAASASYAMVYSNSNCGDPQMKEKARALEKWRENILESAK